MKDYFSSLLLLGLLGNFIYLLGRLHLLYWPLVLPFVLFSLVKINRPIINLIPRGRGVSHLEKTLLLVLIFQIALNSLGLFIPETAFDALWYHLPEASVYASTGTIAKIPEILYSTMPRLGEMYLVLGFLAHSPFILKLISFSFYLLFLLTSYLIARSFLSNPLSLLSLVILNSFPLLAWQSTSAYVDILAALFQLASLLCLIFFLKNSPGVNRLSAENTPGVFLSAIFTGLALSVKMQSITHLLAIFTLLLLLVLRHNFLRYSLFLVSCFLVLAGIITSPWYLDNHLSTGHPFYPLNLPEKQLDQLTHAGATSLSSWLIHQTQTLPLIFIDLGVNPRHQLSPILAILFPLFIASIHSLIRSRALMLLTSYFLIQLFFWHFLPPPESRYLLGALPVLVILLVYSLKSQSSRYNIVKIIALTSIFISLAITFGIRLAASYKYLPLLTGKITRDQYLDSQTTDFNRDIVTKFYSSYWQNYQYFNN